MPGISDPFLAEVSLRFVCVCVPWKHLTDRILTYSGLLGIEQKKTMLESPERTQPLLAIHNILHQRDPTEYMSQDVLR